MSQGKILIIDDDPDIVEAMRVVLENSDYEVESAQDSQAGLERIKANKPDLIILDVMMNTMREGFVLSRKLNESEHSDIPVLMVSAVAEKTGIDFKEAAGDEEWLPVEDFLNKPVKPDVLLEKVANLIKKA